MSCGQPHTVDCAEVIAEVYLYLDGEMAESGRSLIREHLEECGPCLRKFGIEQEVKALVARSCGGDVAPAALRSRLVERLRSQGAAPPGPAGAELR